jgi:DNA-binding FadR family transcriptional regulator
LAHHRALLCALQKRDKRAAQAVFRKHFESLGLMLEMVSRGRRQRPCSQVVSLRTKRSSG